MWTDDEDVDVTFRLSDSDEDPPAPAKVVDPEVWMDYYSEDLLDGWYLLKEFYERRGVSVLDTCVFHRFAQFCFDHSSGYPPPV